MRRARDDSGEGSNDLRLELGIRTQRTLSPELSSLSILVFFCYF